MASNEKKKLSKRMSSKKSKEKKNPYSDRGIDKFSALLEEVEEKKRMIYTLLNPDEVSMIRFVPSGDNKLKPVVVTASNKAFKLKELPSKMMVEEEDEDDKKLLVEEGSGDGGKDRVQVKEEEIEIHGEEKKVNFQWFYMLGGMVILVLVLMAMFGRYWKTFYLLQLQKTICPRV